MTPTRQNTAIRTVTATAAFTFLAAVVIFTLALIATSSQISHAAVPATVSGPLGLFELQKLPNPDGDGYLASIALRPAAYLYAILWILIAAALSFARLRRQTSSS